MGVCADAAATIAFFLLYTQRRPLSPSIALSFVCLVRRRRFSCSVETRQAELLLGFIVIPDSSKSLRARGEA